MRVHQFMGKEVIAGKAFLLGEVCDIEFDENTMKNNNISVKLNDSAIEPLGLKKPRLRGSVIVDIPVEAIDVIGDVVNLNKSVEELKQIIRRH